jgi:hypothetical protein
MYATIVVTWRQNAIWKAARPYVYVSLIFVDFCVIHLLLIPAESQDSRCVCLLLTAILQSAQKPDARIIRRQSRGLWQIDHVCCNFPFIIFVVSQLLRCCSQTINSQFEGAFWRGKPHGTGRFKWWDGAVSSREYKEGVLISERFPK